MPGERRREPLERLRAGSNERGTELRDALRPWGESVPGRESEAATRLSAAFRWPTAAAYSTGSVARAGKSRASTRSKYARRTTGEPLTIDSRSGVNTSAATSPRNCSAARSGAPFTFAFFPARS